MYIHVCVYIYNTISTYYVYIYIYAYTHYCTSSYVQHLYISIAIHMCGHQQLHIKHPGVADAVPANASHPDGAGQGVGFRHENQDLVQTGGIRESNILDLVQFDVDLMEEEVFEMTNHDSVALSEK